MSRYAGIFFIFRQISSTERKLIFKSIDWKSADTKETYHKKQIDFKSKENSTFQTACLLKLVIMTTSLVVRNKELHLKLTAAKEISKRT